MFYISHPVFWIHNSLEAVFYVIEDTEQIHLHTVVDSLEGNNIKVLSFAVSRVLINSSSSSMIPSMSRGALVLSVAVRGNIIAVLVPRLYSDTKLTLLEYFEQFRIITFEMHECYISVSR